MRDIDVDRLVAAVADGEAIDWSSARLGARSRHDERIADALETVSGIRGDVQLPPALVSRRLPIVVEIARLAAFFSCTIGLVGFVIRGGGAHPVRAAIMTALLGFYTSVASFLDVGARDRRSRALASCFLLTASSFAVRGVLEVAARWPHLVLLRAFAAFRPEALLGTAFWHFARDFPARSRFNDLDRLCDIGRRSSLYVGVWLVVANIVPVLWPHSAAASAMIPFDRMTGDGPIFWDLVFGLAIPALVVIAIRGRRAIGPERTRVRLFLYSFAFAFAPVMGQVFLEGIFPSYMRLARRPRGMFWTGLLVYPPLFVFPVSTAYAVAAENVLSVSVAVQQGLRYLLTRWVLMWGAVVPLLGLAALLYAHANDPLSTTLALGVARPLVWAAGVGIVMLTFRQTLLRWLDKWTLSGVEPSATILARMTERMKQTRTVSEIADVFGDGVARALQTWVVTHLVSGNRLVPIGGCVPLPRGSAIEALLNGASDPCMVGAGRRQSYFSLLTDGDRQWIEAQGIEVLVPIVSGRGERTLLAVVGLQRRRNALGYGDDDLRFIRAAASAASLACDALESAGKSEYTDREELAAECRRCGGVTNWEDQSAKCACGGNLASAALPKRLMARFEIQSLLGAGGMGVVYRATDLTLQRDVALKTLPQLSDEAAARLLEEARTMAALRHSDVAVLYSAERWRGTPVLVMEYLSGGTLANRLRQGRCELPVAVSIIRQLADVLERLHAIDLYHGDIKPSNIGFGSADTPKLLDFGLSQAVSAPLVAGTDGAVCGGTWPYLSPEARAGSRRGAAADLWALSVVFCEMLLGRHPFLRARSEDELAEGIERALLELSSGFPPQVPEILRRSLSTQLVLRPQTPSALRSLLDTCM